MKIDKLKIVKSLSVLVGLAGLIIAAKTDDMERSKMKDEIKEEVLTELNGDS